jgi:hypothetical protein
MNDRFFLDSNIFVHCFDASAKSCIVKTYSTVSNSVKPKFKIRSCESK